MVRFLVKVVCYAALAGYLVWFFKGMWRLITKPGKSGRLPWL